MLDARSMVLAVGVEVVPFVAGLDPVISPLCRFIDPVSNRFRSFRRRPTNQTNEHSHILEMSFCFSGLCRWPVFPRYPAIRAIPPLAGNGCHIREFVVFEGPPAGDPKPSIRDLSHLFPPSDDFFEKGGRKTLTK
jgi:hypothetical protein